MAGNLNIIAQGTEIQGNLHARSELRVDGVIRGEVLVEGKMVLAPDGVIEGELRATQADLAGKVKGEVFVEDRLVLKGTAHVEGDIHTRKLIIEEGAVFTGRCLMGEALAREASPLQKVSTDEAKKVRA